MELAVKNMVCDRCLEAVRQIADNQGLEDAAVSLGLIKTEEELPPETLEKLDSALSDRGFELVYDHKAELINRVKTALIEYLKEVESDKHPVKPSEFVQEHVHYNYSYLSNIFSETEGRTIESYLIHLKIERVKELLEFRKWTLSEIAWKLNYSSVQYLSNQFKKVTGETVTEYLDKSSGSRKSLDRV